MNTPKSGPGRIARPGTRRGYDLWAPQYDLETSALLALDGQWALEHLGASAGEFILDAGCGTGRHLAALTAAGAVPIGLDFSHGMLQTGRRRAARSRLVAADLDFSLPFGPRSFDAVLCSLVSEHLTDLDTFFREIRWVLKSGGRLVLSAFHPKLAARGVEANFELDGIEYRLGAQLHTTEDFVAHMRQAGLREVAVSEYEPDEALVTGTPSALKYRDCPMLLVIDARR